ncbi:MAG: NifU family protein [Actinobacteria bacterium]|nr:NifU family protein [Actinomycetota bacterium]
MSDLTEELPYGPDAEDLPYVEVLRRIGELADELSSHPDREVAQKVGELLDWVDAFHREGLGRLVEMVRAWRGEIFLESVASDEITGMFLGAYGLGEDPETAEQAMEAVTAALDELRPYAESHGGSIEFDSITDGVVKIRMLGSCDGCPSSSATLSQGVEEALRRHWPDFRRLELVDDAAPAPPEAPPAATTFLHIRGHEGA